MKKECIVITLLLYTIWMNGQDFIEHPIDDIPGFFTSIRLYDFDNDGSMDIVGSVNGSSQVMAWFASENGGFEDPVIIENESGTPARDIELLDVNNDGNMDIIAIPALTVNNVNFERLVYYLNNGDRTFETFTLIDPNAGSSINNFFSVFDVDNNGFDDIVIRGFSTSTTIVYYPNMGNGSFSTPITLINDSSREVFAQDFNNDGFVDIVLGGGFPQLYINNGDATFTFNTAFNDYPPAQFATLAVSGQLDDNVTPDIIFPNTNFSDTAGVIWYSNDGGANFTFQENITNPSIVDDTYTIARITDFNNDGINDLVAGVRFSPGIGIPFWIQDNSSNFSPFLVETTSDDINNSLEIFDFNNDNKMDFIVGTDDGKLTWFENNFTLSVEDNYLSKISITPNPSEGLYTINNNSTNQSYTIHIYNTLGQKVVMVKNSSTTINLSAQPSGIYIAKIEDSSGTYSTSKKLIKL